ncbi:PQQ-binding-like beta-propeller repeat protein [Streptomyces prunicolor]|uniref:protein kinase domain-containing protein n=1 Tax=Streptomyces prunicolor TaxID=67348 RepID=UPI00371BE9FF
MRQPLQPDDPERVGEYQLLSRLGTGGMGTVYLGRAPVGQKVAVKVVRKHFGQDARYRDRFRREVAAARTVTGTFTATLLKADPEAEVPWLAMEYLPGLSLRRAVEIYGGLPPEALRLLAGALAEALADIHRADLTHRDLKPGNIMLTARGPRVIDFGIARPADASSITLPGTLLGTPGFMSPEQASGDIAGQAGDVFALGAVLAFAATGQEPFRGPDRAATLERVRQARPDLSGITDSRLRAQVAKCLRREPERRPSAARLLHRLGEPTASVHGTGWLPAPLAEDIDASTARRALPPDAVPPVEVPEELPHGTTVDPTAVTDEPSRVSSPGRRRVLVAVAVAAVSATALDDMAWPAGNGRSAPPRSSPSASGQAATALLSTATRRWTTKVLGKDTGGPDLYRVGAVVFAVDDGQDEVRALDPRTGKILWSRAADTSGDAFVTAGTDALYLFDARAGSSTADYTLRAVDPVSRADRWTSRVPFFPWGTAAAASVLCVAYDDEVKALDTGDGRRRWTTRATASSSLTARGGLVVASGDVLTGIDADSGRIRWRRELTRPAVYTVIGDGIVFGCDTVGTVYAVRADDGRIAWRKAFDYRSSVRHAGNGLLYVGEADGRVRAFRAGTGALAWSRRPGGGDASADRSTTLGLSGDTLWVQGDFDATVYALRAADGHTLWTYGAQATDGSPSVSGSGALAVGGLVLLGTWEGRVEAVVPPGQLNRSARGAT